MLPTILILAILVLIGVAFLLTATESAFTYLPRHEAEKIGEEPGHEALRRILAEPRVHMHTLRLVRVLCESLFTILLVLLMLDFAHAPWLAGLLALVIATLGRSHPLKVASAAAGPLRGLTVVLGPVARGLMRGGARLAPPTDESAGFFTEEELREFVDRASTRDIIEDSEAAMLHSIFELDDTRIRAVMVPRTDTVTADLEESLEDALNLFLHSGYSRIPVLGEDIDDVRGFLYLKDVAEAILLERGEARRRGVRDLLRPARFVPESQKVSELLPQMQHEGTHIAVVVDEYGGTAGLVTLEDLIEELVGEIVDEYDTAIPEVERLGDGEYRVSARMSVGDLGELFDVDLDDDDVDTVGGLLAKAIGRVPIVGSSAEIYGIHLKAVKLEGRRNRVGMVLAWQEPGEEDDDQARGAEE
jgi:CBS domain containing-hemolysin-like protein